MKTEEGELTGLLTAEEVAKHLRFDVQTVMVWLKSGELKGVKMGNRWRIRAEDVEAFWNARSAAARERAQIGER